MRCGPFFCALFFSIWLGGLGAAQAAQIVQKMTPGLEGAGPDRVSLLSLWQKQERDGQMGALYESLKNPGSLEGLLTAIDFLKQRLFDKGVAHPVYYLAHAQLLGATGDAKVQETALLSAGIGFLLLQTDRARCADATAGADLTAQVKGEIAAPLGHLFDASLADRRRYADIVLMQEEKRATRPPDRWVCADTQGVRQETLAVLRDRGVPDLALNALHPDALPAINGVTIPIVSDDVWQKRRQEERSRFKAALLGTGE